jgi:hypothetical protein
MRPPPPTAVLLAAVVIAAAQAWSGAAAAPDRSIRAVVFGDFNGPYGSTTYNRVVGQVVRRIVSEWRPDIVLSAGDLVAGQKGDLPASRFPQMWRAFDAAVGGPLRVAGIPLGVALGNHDASAARDSRGGYRFGRERDAAAAYWRDPAHRPRLAYRDGGRFPFYYSFMVDGIFVLVLDATTHVVQDPAWVLGALRSRDAAGARLRIVMGHLPLYGVAAGRSKFGEVVEDGEGWRQQFEANGIDLYLSGHHAAYYPAHRGKLRLLHSGGVGARPYVGHPHIRSRSTVTLMEVDPERRAVALTTFDARTGDRVDLAALPRCISGYNGSIFRVDVPQAPQCDARSQGRTER